MTKLWHDRLKNISATFPRELLPSDVFTRVTTQWCFHESYYPVMFSGSRSSTMNAWKVTSAHQTREYPILYLLTIEVQVLVVTSHVVLPADDSVWCVCNSLDVFSGHPERPSRISRMFEKLLDAGLYEQCLRVDVSSVQILAYLYTYMYIHVHKFCSETLIVILNTRQY